MISLYMRMYVIPMRGNFVVLSPRFADLYCRTESKYDANRLLRYSMDWSSQLHRLGLLVVVRFFLKEGILRDGL